MYKYQNPKNSVNLNLYRISLLPFRDILVAAKDCFPGKIGFSKSFDLLLSNGFDIDEIAADRVEAVFINKRLLSKTALDKIIEFCAQKILNVDFKDSLSF